MIFSQVMWFLKKDSVEFSLNVLNEWAEFSDKNIEKSLLESATSCVKEQDATTVSARHR